MITNSPFYILLNFKIGIIQEEKKTSSFQKLASNKKRAQKKKYRRKRKFKTKRKKNAHKILFNSNRALCARTLLVWYEKKISRIVTIIGNPAVESIYNNKIVRPAYRGTLQKQHSTLQTNKKNNEERMKERNKRMELQSKTNE